jgi:hypothetical protein
MDEHIVILNIIDVHFDLNGVSTKIYANTSSRSGLVLIKDRWKIKRYECVKASLLTSQPNELGFNGRWYFLNPQAGKSVILDEKLIELWELLESLGVRPFFSGQIGSGHLCVKF